jgi:L-alanine-DL-glutamate epimerase-like enolase superfamily enzyme
LKIPVAGGEQDTSWPQWRRMVSQRIVDIAQPDVNYNGGLLRTLRVARLAAAAGLPITPHCPQTGPYQTPNLHFASVVPNLGPFQEYNAAPSAPIPWCTPSLDVQGGMVTVPTGPGLGIEFDPSIWPKAQRW